LSLILDGTNGLSDVDGSAATPAIRGTDTNTGIFFPAADTIAFSEGGVESMRIDSTGNLLVGTTSSVGRTVSEANGASLACLALRNSDTGSVSQGIALFYRNGTLTGSISNTNNATAYNTSSDYRLKENIAPMTGALNKVSQLKPVVYTWKDGGNYGEGFIAHELQSVVPDCVTGEKDAVDAEGNPKYQGIDTSFLVATLTCAIQELKAELDSVKAELATLKAQS
jgi:hypothetical protein